MGDSAGAELTRRTATPLCGEAGSSDAGCRQPLGQACSVERAGVRRWSTPLSSAPRARKPRSQRLRSQPLPLQLQRLPWPLSKPPRAPLRRFRGGISCTYAPTRKDRDRCVGCASDGPNSCRRSLVHSTRSWASRNRAEPEAGGADLIRPTDRNPLVLGLRGDKEPVLSPDPPFRAPAAPRQREDSVGVSTGRSGPGCALRGCAPDAR